MLEKYNDIKLEYELTKNNNALNNGDVVALFSLEDDSNKEIIANIKAEPKYAGIYSDILSFTVSYHDDV